MPDELLTQELRRREAAETRRRQEEATPCAVRLGEAGYEDRYYRRVYKPQADGADITVFRSRAAREFLEGCAWVMRYYTRGAVGKWAWSWYYSASVAPLVVDLAKESARPTAAKDSVRGASAKPWPCGLEMGARHGPATSSCGAIR